MNFYFISDSLSLQNVSDKLQATLGLGDGGEIYILPPERQPSKELKYRISTKVHQRIYSPGLLMNSEQKADEMHVSPAIAKPTVVRRLVLCLNQHCVKHIPKQSVMTYYSELRHCFDFTVIRVSQKVNCVTISFVFAIINVLT